MEKNNIFNILSVKIIVVGSFILFLTNNVFGQDPTFSQFYANPIYLNPAFAGTTNCPRLSLNQRNQYPAISSSFVTTSVSYDQYVDALSGGIGLIVTNDRAGEGTLNTVNVGGIYSYKLTLIKRKFWLQAGLKATWAQKRVDWSQLTFGDQIDPRRGFIYETKEIPRDEPTNYVDFSAGLLGFSDKFFFGFAVDHLTQPDESVVQGVSPLPRRYTFHGGALFPVLSKGDDASLSPNVLVQLQQDFLEINVGMYFSKGPIVGGLWYRDSRNPASIIVSIGFETGPFKFGYSYDINTSELEGTGGAHEFSTGLQFNCKPKSPRFKTITCPSF